MIAAAEAHADEIIVFDENWTTVELFQKLASQWVWSSGGGCLGLNYSSIDFLFRLYRVKSRIDTFEALQIMEYTAIKILSEQDRE